MLGAGIEITDAEIEKLKACKNAVEWRIACDSIKGARGGLYPTDWFRKVVLTGIMEKACGTDCGIKAVPMTMTDFTRFLSGE